MRIAFVGAVDVELQLADGVELVHRDAMAFEARGGGFGAGHGAVEGALVLGQGVDEAVGGGAGADPDDALVVEFRQDEVDGGLGDGLFELILGHAGSEAGRGTKPGIIGAGAGQVIARLATRLPGLATGPGDRPKPLYSCGRPGKRWVRLLGPAQPAQ